MVANSHYQPSWQNQIIMLLHVDLFCLLTLLTDSEQHPTNMQKIK